MHSTEPVRELHLENVLGSGETGTGQLVQLRGEEWLKLHRCLRIKHFVHVHQQKAIALRPRHHLPYPSQRIGPALGRRLLSQHTLHMTAGHVRHHHRQHIEDTSRPGEPPHEGTSFSDVA